MMDTCNHQTPISELEVLEAEVEVAIVWWLEGWNGEVVVVAMLPENLGAFEDDGFEFIILVYYICIEVASSSGEVIHLFTLFEGSECHEVICFFVHIDCLMFCSDW